jgi:exopolyphosphatase/guanosine-5'-triphosphate,3'-diphosphate pyrophosphatase
MGVKRVLAIATAACRDAKNGRAFIKLAERIIRTEIDVLSGAREAELTALGVISGVHQADGVVGDLGGGSLELVDVRGTRARRGLTRPLGGLALRTFRQNRSRRRKSSSRKRSVLYRCSKTARIAPSTRSAAPGGRWRGCTCGRPDIRCT